jgi:hypothetical protein
LGTPTLPVASHHLLTDPCRAMSNSLIGNERAQGERGGAFFARQGFHRPPAGNIIALHEPSASSHRHQVDVDNSSFGLRLEVPRIGGRDVVANPDRSMAVRASRTAGEVTRPASYLAEQVQRRHATTAYSAQGLTVGTSHRMRFQPFSPRPSPPLVPPPVPRPPAPALSLALPPVLPPGRHAAVKAVSPTRRRPSTQPDGGTS